MRPATGRLRLAAALAVHLAVLYWPRTPSAGGVPGVDKVVHVAVFALVAVAALRAGLRVRPVAAALVAHAGVSELLQAAVLPGRSGDPWDVVADLAGVALGVAVGMAAPRRRPRDRMAAWRQG